MTLYWKFITPIQIKFQFTFDSVIQSNFNVRKEDILSGLVLKIVSILVVVLVGTAPCEHGGSFLENEITLKDIIKNEL